MLSVDLTASECGVDSEGRVDSEWVRVKLRVSE